MSMNTRVLSGHVRDNAALSVSISNYTGEVGLLELFYRETRPRTSKCQIVNAIDALVFRERPFLKVFWLASVREKPLVSDVQPL